MTLSRGRGSARATSYAAGWLRLALAGVFVVAMTACSTPEAAPEPPPDPPPTSSSASTTPAPTPEEAAAKAALAAFAGFFRVGEAYGQAPGSRDWEPEINQYSTGSAAAGRRQAIADYVELGIRQVGESTVEPQVTGVDLAAPAGPTVSIKACYDRSTSELVFAQTGVPIKPPGAPDELDRFWWLVTVVQMPGQPWLVSVVDPQIDSAC